MSDARTEIRFVEHGPDRFAASPATAGLSQDPLPVKPATSSPAAIKMRPMASTGLKGPGCWCRSIEHFHAMLSSVFCDRRLIGN
jgi:hypothetical protein